MNMPPQRISAVHDEEFVVFLVGMRFRIRQVKHWRSAFKAMTRMVSELSRDPQSGYLGGESWIGNPTVMIQYWRSFEQLQRYAHDPTKHHQPAWAAFNDAIREGADLGVWHEAYRVRPGEHSTIYNRMPPFGLAKSSWATRVSSRRAAMQRVPATSAANESPEDHSGGQGRARGNPD